jgi:hypothetical protein
MRQRSEWFKSARAGKTQCPINKPPHEKFNSRRATPTQIISASSPVLGADPFLVTRLRFASGVNLDIHDTEFDIVFPPGTTVNDNTRDIVYSIENDGKHRLLHPTNPSTNLPIAPQNPRFRLVVLVNALLLGIALCAGLAWARGRRRT